MKNIIKFPGRKAEDKQCPEKTFEWLAGRTKEYIDFLVANAPKKDRAEWSEKFIAVLKFLGDYLLEDELKEFEERQ